MTEIPHAPNEPIVAVIIPALNEAGKIGRVLDKLPADGRFEAIVVDDGSPTGPATRRANTARPSSSGTSSAAGRRGDP